MKDLLEQKALELITTIEKLSPEVWGTYIKQSYIDGTGATILGLLFTMFACLLTKHSWEDLQGRSGGDVAGLAMFTVSAAWITAAFILFMGVSLLMNPEYRAINSLLGTIS